MKRLYFSLQAVNYSAFLILDLLERQIFLSNLLKFISIVLCLIYSITAKGNIYFIAAMALTTASDFFLLFTEQIEIGLICFCVVQLLYLCFLLREKKYYVALVLADIGLTVLLILVLTFFFHVIRNTVLKLSILYFTFLVTNCIVTFQLMKKNKDYLRLLLCVGFFLFLLCDIHVALFNVSYYLPAMNSNKVFNFTNLISKVIWFYYLPAQVMLSYAGTIIKQKRDC